MKKLPVLLTIFLIITGFPNTGINCAASDHGNLVADQQEHDTTGLLRYLRAEPFNLDIIPPSSGVQYNGNSIIFLSNTKYEGKMLPEHVSFGSIEAYSAIVKDTTLGMHVLFSPAESFSFPCEATTFTSDSRTMYYTKIGKKDTKEKIYHAEYKTSSRGNTTWSSDERPADFCSGDFIYTHPAISAEGNLMIFASNNRNSIGGLDLFVVKKAEGKWSVPQDLGKGINTSKDECYPYLDKDNNLFFSSDGLAGYGGYDIFTCKYNNGSWEKPVNLSKRINSENDDIAFTIERTKGENAFYTVRKRTGKPGAHLVKVTIRQDDNSNEKMLTIGYIYNGNPKPAGELLAAKPAEEVKKTPEPAKSVKPDVKNELKPDEKKPSEKKPDEKKIEEKKTQAPDIPAAKTQEPKVVTIRNTSELPAELRDKVIYRIQFLSTGKPRKENSIVMEGITYKTFEYFYLDLYRYTIGEFTTLGPAKMLQELARKSGYPDAFVAAFKNDTRSLDLSLFK
jgi:hypothetical protein